jgi:4-amino-4-deoxy-L-arabinose transferase-like glycosyltransferase
MDGAGSGGRGTGLAASLRTDSRLLLVAGLFFVLGAVWLGSAAHYHGDERYYTDAALRMIARHDPWTPVYASGVARLNKPLATYWVVMATFLTAGVSLFLARLPFLLAGAVLVWLSGRLARVLFPGQRAIELLAACIVAADVEIVTLARRSTPDILLVLCATATLHGLARILIARESGTAPRAWLWIGAGGAIATKGGLGLVVIAFAFAAAFLLRRRNSETSPVRVRELVSPGTVVLGLAIALAGLVPGFLAHAPATGPTLIEDQVSARIVDSPAAALAQAGNYTLSLLRHFAPWLVLLAVAAIVARPILRDRLRTNRRAFVLALAWTAVLFVVFSSANTHRGRYLVPAHPILACILAAWLCDAAHTSAVRRTARGLTISIALVATIAALALVRVDVAVSLSLAVVVAAAWVGFALERDAARDMRALALALLAASAVSAEAVRALVDPSPVRAACERMVAAQPKHVATAGFFESTASQMRVVSKAQLDPEALPADAKRAELRLFDAVLATAALRNDLEQTGFTVEEIGRVAPDLDARSALEWLTSADPRAWLAHRGEPVWLGLKRSER